MNISDSTTFEQIKAEHEGRTLSESATVFFIAEDISDQYAIVREVAEGRETTYHFFFFTERRLLQRKECTTHAVAIAQVAARYVLDNCERLQHSGD